MEQDFQSSYIAANLEEFQEYQKNVQDIYQVSWKIAITIFIQATLTAIITETFYKLFLRHYLQKWLIKQWVKKRDKENDGEIGTIMRCIESSTGSEDGSTLYALPIQQLCGQVENALRNQLESREKNQPESQGQILIRVFAKNANVKDLDLLVPKNSQDLSEDQGSSENQQSEIILAEERVSYYLERGIDNLQITLAKNWIKIDYFFSILVSFLILQFLLTPASVTAVGTDKNQTVLNLLISLISGFLAPTIRDFIFNIIDKK